MSNGLPSSGKGKMHTSFLVEHETNARRGSAFVPSPTGVRFAKGPNAASVRQSRVSATWQPALSSVGSLAASTLPSRRGTGRASMQMAALQLEAGEGLEQVPHVVISLTDVDGTVVDV